MLIGLVNRLRITFNFYGNDAAIKVVAALDYLFYLVVTGVAAVSCDPLIV